MRIAQMVLPRGCVLEHFATALNLTNNFIICAMDIIHVSLEIDDTLATNVTPVVSA